MKHSLAIITLAVFLVSVGCRPDFNNYDVGKRLVDFRKRSVGLPKIIDQQPYGYLSDICRKYSTALPVEPYSNNIMKLVSMECRSPNPFDGECRCFWENNVVTSIKLDRWNANY
ncbi:hypothetical protein ACOME3_002611 [Neoechinorhynchus agilis]